MHALARGPDLMRAQIGRDDGRICGDRLRQAFGDLAAVVQHHDAVRQLHDQVELVLDQQDRELALQAADDLQHFGGLGRVHAGGRLVEEEHTGFERERTRDLDAPAVGVGEREGRIVDARQQPLAEQREDFRRVGAQLLFLASHRAGADQRQRELGDRADYRQGRAHGGKARVRADQHIVEHREIAEYAAMLERAREAERREFLGRQAGDVAAGEPHRAGVGPVQASNEVEQRGLAGAVRPDHADQRAVIDGEREVVDGGDAAEAAREAGDLEQRRHHIVPSSPCGRKRMSSSSTMP